ncbi:type II toxin-antitoxin system VapC family toxin [Candidatus Micrarchaeota archaeon]|nr:type II toxin-antitoxin system VapC family toxin [Candidatus Micrarchaeota archaeon]
MKIQKYGQIELNIIREVNNMYLLDTNIFLEVILKQQRSEECKNLLYKILSGEVTVVITDFSIYSIVIRMEHENRDVDQIKKFLLSLSNYRGLTIHSLSLHEKILATSLMKEYKLDFDDALQAQAALSNEVKEIISFDDDFDTISTIKRVVPSDLL